MTGRWARDTIPGVVLPWVNTTSGLYALNRQSQSQEASEKPHKFPRIAVFVDGFNLYFGLKDGSFERYLWLDLWNLGQRFLMPGQTLVTVNYFTAMVSDVDKRKRQTDYLEALQVHGKTNVIRGRFQANDIECFKCGHRWSKAEEKKTDVALATEMIVGASKNIYDAAIIVTADSDLVPPIAAIKSHWSEKAVFARFPPNRASKELREKCDGVKHISETDLRKSQLPAEVEKPCGYILKRPSTWK